MDARTFVGWALTGIHGSINILAQLVTQGATLSDHFGKELDRAIERLEALQNATPRDDA